MKLKYLMLLHLIKYNIYPKFGRNKETSKFDHALR
jgi:hypothetical protein